MGGQEGKRIMEHVGGLRGTALEGADHICCVLVSMSRTHGPVRQEENLENEVLVCVQGKRETESGKYFNNSCPSNTLNV